MGILQTEDEVADNGADATYGKGWAQSHKDVVVEFVANPVGTDEARLLAVEEEEKRLALLALENEGETNTNLVDASEVVTETKRSLRITTGKKNVQPLVTELSTPVTGAYLQNMDQVDLSVFESGPPTRNRFSLED